MLTSYRGGCFHILKVNPSATCGPSALMRLGLLCVHLDIADRLATINIRDPVLRLNGVAPNLGQQLFPEQPIYRSSKQNGDANNWKHIEWIAFRIVIARVWGNEWHDGEEDVDQQVKDNDWKPGLERRRPILGWGQANVEQASRDETIDPSTRVLLRVSQCHDTRDGHCRLAV